MKIKYLHLFLHKDLKFSKPLMDMFNDVEKFDVDEHYFIFAHEEIYLSVKKYKNTAYDSRKLSAIVSSYYTKVNWIILHSLSGMRINFTFCLKRKYLNKMILRTWGGSDTGENYLPRNMMINSIRYFAYRLYWKKYRQFYAIGIANQIDEEVLKIKCPGIKTMIMPYSYFKGLENKASEIKSNNKENDVCRILIGHAGSRSNNHINILKSLKKYKEEKFMVILLLSYGDQEYINEVIDYSKTISEYPIEIVSDYFGPEEYMDFISKIDIGILDGKESYALGALSRLLYFEKKIVLNRDGLIGKVLLQDGIEHNYSDEIGNISFEKFVSPVENKQRLSKSSLAFHGDLYCIEKWQLILDELI